MAKQMGFSKMRCQNLSRINGDFPGRIQSYIEGGLSCGYKKSLADKDLTDDTYTTDSIALIRISGTSIHNNKTEQVDAVATSLNSTECFLLQSGSTIFTWHGNQSTFEQQQLAAKVAEFLKPGVAIKHAKEGTESSAFWFPLGGKQSYISKRVSPEIVRDPHLLTFSFNKGKFEVEEIHNFSQDDLLTEDILILDTHAEVFVWVGQAADSKEKQSVFEIGQNYIDVATCLEGLSPKVPLYKVTEGNEPCFFTTFFSWDPTKATVQGNSFQKKVALLFGASHAVEDKSQANQGGPTQRASALAALSSALNPSSGRSPSPSNDNSNGSSQGGHTQRASALAALSSAFSSPAGTKAPTPKPSSSGQGSQRAAAVAALSSVLTGEKKKSPDTSPTRSNSSSHAETSPPEPKAEYAHSESEGFQEVGEVKEMDEVSTVSETDGGDSEPKQVSEEDENGSETRSTFSYDQLKAKSDNPVTGIDFKRREAYLSDEEFQTVFGTTKEAFYKLPKWKQDMQKKKVDLF